MRYCHSVAATRCLQAAAAASDEHRQRQRRIVLLIRSTSSLIALRQSQSVRPFAARCPLSTDDDAIYTDTAAPRRAAPGRPSHAATSSAPSQDLLSRTCVRRPPHCNCRTSVACSRPTCRVTSWATHDFISPVLGGRYNYDSTAIRPRRYDRRPTCLWGRRLLHRGGLNK